MLGGLAGGGDIIDTVLETAIETVYIHGSLKLFATVIPDVERSYGNASLLGYSRRNARRGIGYHPDHLITLSAFVAIKPSSVAIDAPQLRDELLAAVMEPALQAHGVGMRIQHAKLTLIQGSQLVPSPGLSH